MMIVLAFPERRSKDATPLQLRPVRQLTPPPGRHDAPTSAALKTFKELVEKDGDGNPIVKEGDKEALESAETFYHHHGYYPSYYHYPSYYYPYYSYPYYGGYYGYPYYG